MSSKHTLFRIFYRLGFTPWDGHPTGAEPARPWSKATMRCPPAKRSNSVAVPATARSTWPQHGWQVTAVDYVQASAGKSPRQGGSRRRGHRLRPRRRHPLELSRPRRQLRVDRRQRLPAQHERRRPRRLRPRGQRHGGSGRAVADRRIRSRRQVRCAGRRTRRDGATIQPRLDAAVRRQPSGNWTRNRPRLGTTSIQNP